MHEQFQTAEALLADESFYCWYLKNDQEAVSQWESWINESPAHRALATEAITLLQALRMQEGEVPAGQVSMAYSKLQQHIHHATPVVSIKRRRSWMIAAAVIILAIAGVGIIKYMTGSPSIETAYGQIKEQQLPDGSEVTLNAHSKISFSAGFREGKDREVWLSGEAFFHVKKTPQCSRFIVHTSRFDIIVTGTRFNVVNRSGKTNVLLKEGSVIVHTKDGKEVYMKPGDFVEVDDNQLNKKQDITNNILAWKEKKMIFEKTPMREVARTIEEHYGVKVILNDDNIASKEISGIMANDNLETLLSALEATTEFRIDRNGNNIIMRSNP